MHDRRRFLEVSAHSQDPTFPRPSPSHAPLAPAGLARNTARVSPALPPSAPSPLAPGYKLDRYELLCPIAEGGMASVWIARQTGKHGFQKLVAVKTILPKYAAEPVFQQMFLDEVRIASRIEHSHVTQILDVGEQHDVTYLVMEYVDGDALSKVHRAAREAGRLMHPGVLLRVMADACGGLHAAHELHGPDRRLLGVVHRDVSPQNILVSTKGVSKLIDFGIAKARNRLAEDTNAGQLKGKVRYMAPEQALGQPVDRRADVWAVGAVLYHLLSGRAPFEGENDVKTLFLLTSGRPPMPMRGDVHPTVAAVVRRALSHDPGARFATAAEMQEALEEAIREAGLVTTSAEVATYLAGEVGARAQKRKEAIALGLSAADAREKYADIMRANTDRSTATGATGARVIAERLTAQADQVASEEVTVRDGLSASRSSAGQTLGSAAVAIPARDGARGLRLAIVGCVVGAAISVLALGALQGSKSKGSAASAPRETAPAIAEPRGAIVPPVVRSAPNIPPPPPATPEAPASEPTSLAAHAAPSPAESKLTAQPARASAPLAAEHVPAPSSFTETPPSTPSPAARAPRPAPPSTAAPRVNDGF